MAVTGLPSSSISLRYVFDSICLVRHNGRRVIWDVELHEEFVPEYNELPEDVQDELMAIIEVLEQIGPQLGRPRVDTLNGSAHANMKELRFDAAGGVWRFAFAFDPKRQAIVLCGGDKSGGGEKRFYRHLIAKADKRFDLHLTKIAEQKKTEQKKQRKKR
jgi:hypothetical protein